MDDVPGGSAKSGPSTMKMVGIGCLVVAVIVIGFGVYVGLNLRKWSATVVQKSLMAVGETADLSPEQKSAFGYRVERLGEDFQAGNITYGQLGQIAQEMTAVFQAAVLYAFDERYIKPSVLSDAEKAQGRLTLRRFVRGELDGTIPAGTVDEVLRMASTERSGGKRAMKETLTRSELEEVLARMKQEADNARVPEGPHEPDFAGSIDRATQRILGKTYTPPETQSGATTQPTRPVGP